MVCVRCCIGDSYSILYSNANGYSDSNASWRRHGSCKCLYSNKTTVAATTLGSAAIVAVIIGIAAGGVGALEALRDRYKIVEKDNKHIKLQRK